MMMIDPVGDLAIKAVVFVGHIKAHDVSDELGIGFDGSVEDLVGIHELCPVRVEG